MWCSTAVVRASLTGVAFLVLAPTLARGETPAEIKRNVVVVRPTFHEKTREVFGSLAKVLKLQSEEIRALARNDRRYAGPEVGRYADTLLSLATTYGSYSESPGHGSGWVWIPNRRSGAAFVVTNRHVAGQARDVVIELRKGERRQISGEVIYVSEITDLAVIEIAAKELPSKVRGLRLVEQPFEEGDPVYASGYPGTTTATGRRASYSLTDGIISNADFDSGVDDGLTVEHTATIDPGNSGGPLLVRSRGRSFRVVGMNTAFNTSRRNSNLAVPADLIAKELQRAMRGREVRVSPKRMQAELRDTAERLAEELGSARPDLTLLRGVISYAYVGERPDNLTKPVELWLKGDLNDQQFNTYLRRPVELARYLLFRELSQAWGSDADSVGEVALQRIIDEEEVASGGPVRSLFKVHGSKRELTWIWEHGAWRIAYAALPSGGRRAGASAARTSASGARASAAARSSKSGAARNGASRRSRARGRDRVTDVDQYDEFDDYDDLDDVDGRDDRDDGDARDDGDGFGDRDNTEFDDEFDDDFGDESDDGLGRTARSGLLGDLPVWLGVELGVGAVAYADDEVSELIDSRLIRIGAEIGLPLLPYLSAVGGIGYAYVSAEAPGFAISESAHDIRIPVLIQPEYAFVQPTFTARPYLRAGVNTEVNLTGKVDPVFLYGVLGAGVEVGLGSDPSTFFALQYESEWEREDLFDGREFRLWRVVASLRFR